MKPIKINERLKKYFLLCFSLIISFWLITLFEICSQLFSGAEVQNVLTLFLFKMLNHVYTAIFISVFFFPFYYFLSKKKKKFGIIFIKVIFIVLVLIEFSLTKYSNTTLLNLGADLLGYSLDDIFMTVTSSENTSVLYFIPFIIFPSLFLVSYFFLKKAVLYKYINNIFFGLAFLVIILKIGLFSFSETKYQNKSYYFTADVIKYKKEKSKQSSYKQDENNEFPFLKPSESTPDVLSPFFTLNEEKPNIVILLVEGLGSEFVGENYYSGFTPYLDSLIPESLFWPNFLSNTGRTFGALPSLMASLPFGEKGFLEVENTPSHESLFSILKNNGYTTSFFGGDKSSFDKKINFLEYNYVENIIDEAHFDDSYPKAVNKSNGFSWGYSDNEIFTKALGFIDKLQSPRLDLITTQTIHEPFDFPEKEKYLVKIDSVLNSDSKFEMTNREIKTNKEIFASIYYADKSIEKFMKAYEKRDDFKNTVFIITGDHRLIPIAQKDKLCRFNVPLFIYSPMLKKTSKIKSISSHFDVAPSILAFLSKNYEVTLPKESAWLGEGLDTVSSFRNVHKIPLMRYKGSINDYIYKEYMFSDGDLFKIREDFETNKISDKVILKEITESFQTFKNYNAYTTKNNKIYPENAAKPASNAIKLTEKEIEKVRAVTANLSADEMFDLARTKAFNKESELARLICDYILMKSPNYADVRILKGRVLAWDGFYEESEIALLGALKRFPLYDDIYLAILDMYWWSSQNDKSMIIAEKAFKNKIKNDDVAFKIARVYRTMNDEVNASKIIDSILKKQPQNKAYIKFKNSLK